MPYSPSFVSYSFVHSPFSDSAFHHGQLNGKQTKPALGAISTFTTCTPALLSCCPIVPLSAKIGSENIIKATAITGITFVNDFMTNLLFQLFNGQPL